MDSLFWRASSVENVGGGIANSGTLTISQSTITRNTALGGGILNSGTLTITDFLHDVGISTLTN